MNNLGELEARMHTAFETITPDMLANVRTEFYDRLGFCLTQFGETIENNNLLFLLIN